ncbi:MAG: UDP-N-acetylmuramoyl-L-alanine--D-glutamate ligase, partial [Lachnospiraceae bacterium]|nr:UDP-N-acetylmuramoyl-L-alanine--D-glutamate ligase [Lachnospiraceae bacterium]
VDKLKRLILMGQSKDKIEECARKHGFNAIVKVDSMEDAVKLASNEAKTGETVLLSPCCASWGMFKDYEERGRIFKELVNKL